MSTISVEEISRDPGRFVQRIESGEPLLVMRGEEAVAEVKPISRPSRELRPFGLAAGEFTVPDDFDRPLPNQVIAKFRKLY